MTALAMAAKQVSAGIKASAVLTGAMPGGEDEEAEESDPCIKVCVRVRPFIKEELQGERCEGPVTLCIEMPTKTTVNMFGKIGGETRCFEFDRCYWSHDQKNSLFADQETLYQEIGQGMISQAMKGFNNCIFAYGQTGSGKSHSVLGGQSEADQGLLPRIVKGLFLEFGSLEADVTSKCLVSFIEIYNEQIRDLLRMGDKDVRQEQKLEVRQHPTAGSIIPGLTEAAVESEQAVMKLVDYGVTMRHVSATAMNATSSRSHCIFSFKTSIVEKNGDSISSQTHLVDLAGSERAGRTKATGDRLREGAAINQSLSVLARVISELAKASTAKAKKKNAVQNVPFRDSKITYILKDSLSGNSKTVMMAALSPNLQDYDETLSTLNFCKTVKLVQTSAKKNEGNERGLEAQLRAELDMLKDQLKVYQDQEQGRIDADHRKLSSSVMKQIDIQKELLFKHSEGSWPEQLEAEKRRQERRRGIMLHLEEVEHQQLVDSLAAFYRERDSDADSDATDESWHPDEDSMSDGGIFPATEKMQERHAKIEDMGRKWDLLRRKMAKDKTDDVVDALDLQAEKRARSQYEDMLMGFRSNVSREMEKMEYVMRDVEERLQSVTDGDLELPPVGGLGGPSNLARALNAISQSSAFLELEQEIQQVKGAVEGLSQLGAPELKLRVMVAINPSESPDLEPCCCVQAGLVTEREKALWKEARRKEKAAALTAGEEVRDELQIKVGEAQSDEGDASASDDAEDGDSEDSMEVMCLWSSLKTNRATGEDGVKLAKFSEPQPKEMKLAKVCTCGKEFYADALFCGGCGAKRLEEEAAVGRRASASDSNGASTQNNEDGDDDEEELDRELESIFPDESEWLSRSQLRERLDWLNQWWEEEVTPSRFNTDDGEEKENEGDVSATEEVINLPQCGKSFANPWAEATVKSLRDNLRTVSKANQEQKSEVRALQKQVTMIQMPDNLTRKVTRMPSSPSRQSLASLRQSRMSIPAFGSDSEAVAAKKKQSVVARQSVFALLTNPVEELDEWSPELRLAEKAIDLTIEEAEQHLGGARAIFESLRRFQRDGNDSPTMRTHHYPHSTPMAQMATTPPPTPAPVPGMTKQEARMLNRHGGVSPSQSQSRTGQGNVTPAGSWQASGCASPGWNRY